MATMQKPTSTKTNGFLIQNRFLKQISGAGFSSSFIFIVLYHANTEVDAKKSKNLNGRDKEAHTQTERQRESLYLNFKAQRTL